MVQQTDSMFSEYPLPNSETGYPKQDKKHALKDLQNVKKDMVPESDGRSLLKENVTAVEDFKIAGMKRPQQTHASNNGHLVYVRRKTESEQHKNSTCNQPRDQPTKQHEHDGNNHGQYPINDLTIGIQKSNDEPTKAHEHDEKHYPMNDSTIGIHKTNDQPTKVHEYDGNNHEQYPTNDLTVGIQKAILESKSSERVSSTTPAPTLDSEKSNVNSLSIPHWEERYLRLQNFLKAMNLSNQDDYLKMLRSLSSVGLSRVAVELERRSIQLSMEEAREVQRTKLVDVLDKFPINAQEQHRAAEPNLSLYHSG